MQWQLNSRVRYETDNAAGAGPARMLAGLLALAGCSAVSLAAAESTQLDLERRFTGTVQPFVETYCITCHGKEKPKADFDLSPYATMDAVVRGHEQWEMVLEKLQAAEMPPEKAKQHPTAQLRKEVVDWIQALRRNEAKKNAGDPGSVRFFSPRPGCRTIRFLTYRLLTDFAFHSQARPPPPTESSSRGPPAWADGITDWPFSFRCSPPRVAATQLRFDASRFLTARERTRTALSQHPFRRTSSAFTRFGPPKGGTPNHGCQQPDRQDYFFQSEVLGKSGWLAFRWLAIHRSSRAGLPPNLPAAARTPGSRSTASRNPCSRRRSSSP